MTPLEKEKLGRKMITVFLKIQLSANGSLFSDCLTEIYITASSNANESNLVGAALPPQLPLLIETSSMAKSPLEEDPTIPSNVT